MARAPRFAGSSPASGRAALTAAFPYLAAWLIYAAVYACVFFLSGFTPGPAIRGGICNALPDGLLALAVLATTRRLAAPEVDRQRFLLSHAALAVLLASISAALKSFLLFVDVALTRGTGAYKFQLGIFTWQIFLSLLTYAAVAGAAHAHANTLRLRQAAEAAERAETLRARAELSALRAQLNPHFLFNVLHSVLGLVRRDPALAEQALERLGDLLRYALHVHRDGVDWISLRQEWEFMECYLGLEKIRLADRLRFSLEADDPVLDRQVPTFLLQPLVENAVRHGIAPRAAGGSVRVTASLVGSDLHIQVDNDGVQSARQAGRTRDDAASSGSGGHPGLARPMEDEQSGLGLRLLQDRLSGLYGGRAAISSGPTPEGGFRVVLILPDAGIIEETPVPAPVAEVAR